MMTLKAQFLVLVVVLSLIPGPLFAEDNLRELLLVSLADFYTDGTKGEEISIFAADEAGTPPCVPENAQLVGGFTRGGSTSWTYKLKTSGSSALAACVDSLEKGGFTQRKERGGLVGLSTSAWLCMKDRFVSFSHVQSEGHHYLIESSPIDATSCVDFDAITFSPLPSSVPRLVTPDGIFSQSDSSSWSGDNFSSTQTLFSVEVSGSLLDHYSDQIVSAGWRATSRLLSDSAALATFEKSVDGKGWTLSIINLVGSRGVDVHLFVNASAEKP